MPQIATVSLSKIAFLKPDQVSITKALAVLPPNFLSTNHRHNFYKDRIKWGAIGTGLAVLGALGTGAYAASVYAAGDPSLFSQLAITAGGALTLLITRGSVLKAVTLTKVIDVTEQIKVAGEETNEVVIYKEDDEFRRVGLLSLNDKGRRIVTDKHGYKKTISFEQLAQLAVIRDNEPFGMGFNKQELMEATPIYADSYAGATLAFTHNNKNYLSTVTDVVFSQGEGIFFVITAAGEELQIQRGERMHDKPTLLAPDDSENFSSGDEIRGVLFLP